MAKPQELLDQFVANKAEDEKLTKDEMADIRKQARKLGDVNTNLAFARMAVASSRAGTAEGFRSSFSTARSRTGSLPSTLARIHFLFRR